MTNIVTLTARHTISVPKAVRDGCGWKAGQRLAFVPKGAGVLLVPVPAKSELAGIMKGAKAGRSRDRRDRF